MNTTGIQARVEEIQSKINVAEDIDKLREYSLKLVDLLINVDKLVDLSKEQIAALENKVIIYRTVAKGLVDVVEEIEIALKLSGVYALDSIAGFETALAKAKVLLGS